MTKKCSICKKDKDFEDFYRHKGKPDGFSYSRKECQKVKRDLVRPELNKKSDPLFKFKCQIRTLIKVSFKRGFLKKQSKTQDILGIEWELIKNYLEHTWFLNYGTEYNNKKVHIDHIIPISFAKTKEEVLKLNHCGNLQYLKPVDNIIKSNKVGISWP